ncbi:UDP-N-acetyl-D-mannosaminuronate dehydrogenase [Candidatus Nitrososphaera evergladensis SR1]|jgi:nucleotide sugar dehydrogenase|uniref:UDP-N-acetyl-D-mannosaminuronate dehydrogenase n=1 Tax=Candidatus Nitrososphaera evergladensis SR1 TaxID=1459636 RepID=A0A075MVJ5_9ARCH|nr:NAD(P)-binding domain-containing protein [Candidatus Nitrososphaera evergladensis]AIF85188.1 UDP-N-acetyl-D-mannosaminuronate dehydrogenase [Candidatus Nitrososphaera evergladensis SR1]
MNNNSNNKVLVIGLGQIGYSNAEYMTMKGLTVDGYDISEKAIQRAVDDQVIRKRAQSFAGYDYYIICISTHRPEDMFQPYLDGLFDIARQLLYEGKQGALVGIDSTITRGTSEKIKEILGHRLHVVHVPHRYFGPEKHDHGVNQTRVIGGCGECCIEAAKHFYGNLLDIPLHTVESVEVAELCKIVENSYRFMEIAFAEELKMFCDRSAIDFQELREAINTKWNIKVLEPREGIGGHCLPKDSQMFLNLSKNLLATSIIDAAKKVDEEYRAHIADVPSKKLPPIAQFH